MLDIQTVNTTFTLQGRTERVTDNTDKATNATIFSAFAAKDDTNSTVQVGLSSNKTGKMAFTSHLPHVLLRFSNLLQNDL